MAFYKKIRTKTVFTLQGKLKVTNTNLNCIRTWVHSRNTVFKSIFHSYTSVCRCHSHSSKRSLGGQWGGALDWVSNTGLQPSSGWRCSRRTRWRALHRRRSGSSASLPAFISLSQEALSRMMSVENDSTTHARYSSIPADPSLTVLKLSIKQHKGEKKVLLNSSSLRTIRCLQAQPRGLQRPR